MNKRILLSGISLFSSLALVTGATFAFFSDVGTSQNNVFAAGTLDLDLNNQENSSANFSVSGLAPGTPGAKGSVELNNNGSIAIAEVELGANQVSPVVGPNLSDVLDLTVLTGANSTCTDGSAVDHTPAINTQIGGGNGLQLSDLITTDYDALPSIPVAGDYFVCITATMQSTAGDVYQGLSTTVDITFKANQDATQ